MMKLSSAALFVVGAVLALSACKKDEPAPVAEQPKVEAKAAEPAPAPAPEPAPTESERDRYVKAAIEIGCAAKADDAAAKTMEAQKKYGFDAESFKAAATKHATGAAMDIAKGLQACK